MSVRFMTIATAALLFAFLTMEVRTDDTGWCLHFNTNYHLMVCHNGTTDYTLGASSDDSDVTAEARR